jgi:hypothetical protein
MRLQGQEVPFVDLEDGGGLFGRLARMIRSGEN